MRCESKYALMKWTFIHQLSTFIKGLKIDINAVINCIKYKNVSNGIVEGFVNKLKEEKRVMYGRAKIELLRRKMVLSSICFN